MKNTHLRRFWFKTEGHAGYGVTAYFLEDAESLLAEAVAGIGMPLDVEGVVEDVDVSELDPEHVVPNMGPPSLRGVWCPNLVLD